MFSSLNFYFGLLSFQWNRIHMLLSGAFVYYQALETIRDDIGAQGRLTLGVGLWSNYLSQKTLQFICQQQWQGSLYASQAKIPALPWLIIPCVFHFVINASVANRIIFQGLIFSILSLNSQWVGRDEKYCLYNMLAFSLSPVKFKSKKRIWRNALLSVNADLFMY